MRIRWTGIRNTVSKGIFYLEKGLDEPVPGGEVPDETGAVHGYVAALRAVKGDLLSQQGRHLVLYSTTYYQIFLLSFIKSEIVKPAVLWIRIRTGAGFRGALDPYPDPDPRGQKWLRKIRYDTVDNFHLLKCRAEAFSCNLEVLYGGLFAILIKKP